MTKRFVLFIIVVMEKIYYLDNAATTKAFPETFKIMEKSNAECYFNPSASYDVGIKAKQHLEEARQTIMGTLGTPSGKLVFVSSATEANNMVFQGVHIRSGQKVLVSSGEHPSVYYAAKRLMARGIDVQFIPLKSDGRVDETAFEKMLDEKVALVSIIHVSNETGAVNDIAGLFSMAKKVNDKIIFHSDGVQAFGKIKVNLRNLGVDLYTISAHKVYAPRGIAGLFVKDKVVIDPLLVGGGQEFNLRSSTESVDLAQAFAFSAKKICSEFDANFECVKKRKMMLIDMLKCSEIGEICKINSNEDSSPYILSITFLNAKGEVLVNSLSRDGILISTGSACSSKKAGNRILEAMGMSNADVVGSVRISFSPYEDFDAKFVADKITETVKNFSGSTMGKK